MTAVEQLIYDLRNIDMSIFNDEHCKKYLEIEKQQIKDAWDNGAYGSGEFLSNIETSQEYYNHIVDTNKMIDHIGDTNKMVEDTPMLSRLKAHLASITPEEFDKEIDDIIKNDTSVMLVCDECGMEECECGLTPDEQIIKDLHNDRKSHAIDFAKWLAKEWMSMWVVDRWLWEYQLTMTEAQSKDYLGYKTEEQLYELYLKETL